MKSSPSPATTFRSKKILRSNSKSSSPDESQSSDLTTPQKSIQLPRRRSRNQGIALSVEEVRKCAQDLHKSQKEETLNEPDPVESVSDLSKSQKKPSIKLPEKYELLFEFFKSMLISIRLLLLRKKMTSFTNISPKIESLTDRRFSYTHLAQLKYILPEAIILNKVLLQDEHTLCMKPDLHISLQTESFEMVEKGKSGYSILEKEFRSRLVDFFKSHPQGDEVPEDTLPTPFNQTKQALPDVNEGSNRLSSVESSSSSSSSSGCLPLRNSVMASHLSQSFQRRFSQKVPIFESEKTNLVQETPTEPSNPEASDITFKNNLLKESPCSVLPSPRKSSSLLPIIRNTSAGSSNRGRLPPLSPLSVSAEIKPKYDNDNSKDTDSIEGTPAKLISTPARLMTVTPDLRTPKRSRQNQNDDSAASPSKLVRRPPRMSLFNTPVKNTKAKERISDEGRSSVDLPNVKLLPEELVQSIRENEKKIMEEQDPDITRAKLRKRTIACLPKMFDMIHLTYQSMNRSVTTKQDLIHKIIAGHCDVIDRKEVEEQLTLLKELVPEWISEQVTYSGDITLRINRTASIDSLRRKLAEAV